MSVVCAVMTSSLIGCGGGTDGRISVSGTVTLDGEPLQSGSIIFYQGAGSAGVGTIENGSFTVSEAGGSEGVQPGSYKVAIESWEVTPGDVNDQGEIVAAGKSRIPKKYNSAKTSGLTIDVKEGAEAASFALTSN